MLEQLAALSGGRARFLEADGWSAEDARGLAAALEDRSRREYETGSADADFKRRLNGILLGLGAGLLCVEWIIRRLAKLA
jgi:hypothetical protein